MNSFGPVITAMVTPFDEYNQLNIGSLRKLIIHLLKHGSTSLVITGTTGEAPTLTAIERLRVWGKQRLTLRVELFRLLLV